MHRNTFIMLVACASFVTAPSLADSQQPRPNYYPIKEGSKWHYRVDVPGAGAKSATLIAAKLEKIDGVDMFRMDTAMDGIGQTSTEHLTSNDRGVFRHRFNGQPASKPVCLLKYPVTPGESWKEEIEIAGEKLTVSINVSKEEEVKVPAGQYKAIPVQIQVQVMNETVKTTYWFAVDVGIVKQTAEVAGININMELEKYEPAR